MNRYEIEKDDELTEVPTNDEAHEVEPRQNSSSANVIEQLGEFEKHRAKHFSIEISKLKEYIQAVDSLLHDAKLKNMRLICFLQAKLEADRNYARSLLVLREVAMKLEHKRRKPATSEKEKDIATAMDIMQKQQAEVGKKDKKTKSSKKSTKKDESQLSIWGGALDDCYMMQILAAQQLEKSADAVERDILENLNNLAEKIEDAIARLQKQGEACKNELESGEKSVDKAWTCLLNAADEYAKSGDEHGTVRRDKVRDVWIHDMKYRVAVNVQKASSDLVFTHVEELISNLKEIEANRRRLSADAVQQYLIVHESLCTALDKLKDPIVANLLNVDSSVQQIDSELNHRMAMREKDNAVQWKVNNKNNENVEDEVDSSPHKFRRFTEKIESPFDTMHFVSAKMMNQKPSPVLPFWKPCVLVVTDKRALHVFHAQDDFSVQSDPEQAFSSLIPKKKLEVDQAKKTMKMEDFVVAHASIDLHNCLVARREKAGAHAFEIKEVYKHSGMTSWVKSQGSRKFLFQAKNADELSEFLEVLNLPTIEKGVTGSTNAENYGEEKDELDED